MAEAVFFIRGVSMAFIELTEDEIAVLSDTEKKQYDRQLRLHRDRIAFVEKLEKIESANYQYQKPKIKRIKPVRRIDLPKYKAISDVKITLPEHLMKRSDIKAKQEAQQTLIKKISERIVGEYRILQIPVLDKIKSPSPLLYRGTKKIEISGVAENTAKPAVPVLNFKGVERLRIKNVPERKKVVPPNVSFEFERKPLNVTAPKTNIPLVKKFTGLNAVNISNVPTVSVGLVTLKKYTPVAVDSQAISEVNEKAVKVMIKSPKLSYKAPQIADVVVPKIQTAAANSASDISAIKMRMADSLKHHSIDIASVNAPIPPKLSIGTFVPSKPDVHIPQVKAATLPNINKVQIKSVDVNVNVKPQTVEIPVYTVSPIKHPEIEKTEVVKVNTPHITESDVANVLSRVMNGI